MDNAVLMADSRLSVDVDMDLDQWTSLDLVLLDDNQVLLMLDDTRTLLGRRCPNDPLAQP